MVQTLIPLKKLANLLHKKNYQSSAESGSDPRQQNQVLILPERPIQLLQYE